MFKEADQDSYDPQSKLVGPPSPFVDADHQVFDTQNRAVSNPHPVSDEVVHCPNVIHCHFDNLILQIKETHRLRQDLHRTEKSLTLQIKAIERRLGGASARLYAIESMPHHPISDEDHSQPDTQDRNVDIAFFAALPLQEARAVIKKGRMKAERQLAKLSRQLPVWPWVESIHGFGALGLAQIIGETGNLSNYASPAKLWKRMGLAVINGESQRRRTGLAAIEQGYNPKRRSIMYCIGDSMIKKQNEYREIYLARKEIEQQKKPDATKLHWHRRAQRYMEKRLLKHLWQQWKIIQLSYETGEYHEH